MNTLAVIALISGSGLTFWSVRASYVRPRTVEELRALLDRDFEQLLFRLDNIRLYQHKDVSLLRKIGGLQGLWYLVKQTRIMNKIASTLLEEYPEEFASERLELPNLPFSIYREAFWSIWEEILALLKPSLPHLHAQQCISLFCAMETLQHIIWEQSNAFSLCNAT